MAGNRRGCVKRLTTGRPRGKLTSASVGQMRVRTPASVETVWRSVRVSDAASVLSAGPVAAALRDPNLFAVEHIVSTFTYCMIGVIYGLLMLIFFRLGKTLSNSIAPRMVESIVAVSLVTAALTSFTVFSFNRLDSVPRALPVIHFLVLTALLFADRLIAVKWRTVRKREGNFQDPRAQHVLLIGANPLAWSYLRMLDAVNADQPYVAALLDESPKLLGRSLFGYSVIAPPSALDRVVKEYQVHGVHIDRVLVASNRVVNGLGVWSEVEECCRRADIPLGYLGDMLGVELSNSTPVFETPAPSLRASLALKRAFDFSLLVAIFPVFLIVFAVVALGVLIELEWPVVFWQKRVGYKGRPFLVYKFRTLHAPFDRQGRFVAEDKRVSRFGAFLRRSRLDELPQLWNVLVGDMSFVGPRPLLPVDQPTNSGLRLTVRPGVTGWAQVNGGAQVSAEQKGLLDGWYVKHASLKLDIWIILRTLSIVIFGDKPAGTPEAKTYAAERESVTLQ